MEVLIQTVGLGAWHQYIVQVTAQARLDRDQLAKCLDAAGIDAVAYYPKLVHDYPCYRGHPRWVRRETSLGPPSPRSRACRCPCTRPSAAPTSAESSLASAKTWSNEQSRRGARSVLLPAQAGGRQGAELRAERT